MRSASFAVASHVFLALTLLAQSGSGDRVASTEWLARHLADDNLVLLESGWTRGNYKAEHIRGARFLWLNGFTQGTPDLSTELPDPEKAASMLRDLGITESSQIVIYFEGENVTPTARMILTFDYLGLGNRVSYLDGGLEAWKREGRPLTKEIPKSVQGTYTLQTHPEFIADAAWVKAHLNAPDVTIIDARAPRYYEGNGGGMPRPGHIPGAVNIPYSSVVDSSNLLLSRETLKELFEKAGVKPGSKVVTYCHVGQQASLLYFVARYLGYNACVYDGSFQEWSSNEDLPIENPSVEK